MLLGFLIDELISTASVVILREDYHLIIGHIGDCGIRVIREINVVF